MMMMMMVMNDDDHCTAVGRSGPNPLVLVCHVTSVRLRWCCLAFGAPDAFEGI